MWHPTQYRYVHVSQLVKRYGDMVALDYFDLDVTQGEIFGLLG